MESVNGTLKVECVNNVHFATRDEARQAIVEYIGYYHAERRHSLLGNIAPAEFERRWRAGIEPEEQGLAVAGAALRTDGRFPVRRKQPNRPSVDNAHRALWRPLNGGRFTSLGGAGGIRTLEAGFAHLLP